MLPARRQGVPLLRAIHTAKGLFSPAGILKPPATAARFADGSCTPPSPPSVPSSSLAPGRRAPAAFPALAARHCSASSSVRTSADPPQQGNGPSQLQTQTITYVHGMFDGDGATSMFGPESTPLEFASKFALLEKVKLIGEKVEKDYPVLTDVGKVLFGSLFVVIEKLRRHGYSFQQPVSVAQLMVDRYGLFLVKDGTLLQKTCERAVSDDYFGSASVFEELIRCSCGDGTDIPGDFKELLRILRMKKSTTHLGYFTSVHPSLVRLRLQWSVYYTAMRKLLYKDNVRKIAAGLKRCTSGWTKVVVTNTLLGTWYRQGDNNRSFCDCPEDMLTFLWNVHLNPFVYEELYGKEFKEKDVTLLLWCKFPKFLPALYWEMWKEGLLAEIDTEKYFCGCGQVCSPEFDSCLRMELRLMNQPRGANSPSVEALVQ